MEIYDKEGNLIRVEERKVGWWQKIGGGSLMIAALFHAVLLVVGGFWVFRIIQPPSEEEILQPINGRIGEPRAQVQLDRAQITPPTSANRIIVPGAEVNYVLPEQSGLFGDGASLNSPSAGIPGGGLDGKNGSVFEAGVKGPDRDFKDEMNNLGLRIQDSMRKRCSREDRLARLKENGGTPACEEAVLKGLRWLKGKQNPDGSWGPQKHAMTGLVLLAYFGHCETPMSEEFGESCLRGILYLVNEGVKNNGLLSTNIKGQNAPYEHAIATYALGEAATFCKALNYEVPSLMEVTQKAGQFIIDNQNENGGWAYGYGKVKGSHTDSSVVGWQLQALKACKLSHLSFKGMDPSVAKGLEYLTSLQNENGGFGYNSKSPRIGTSGVGVLSFQMWGKEKSSEVRSGLKYIKDNIQLDWNSADSDLYAHYYISQAMMQAGGSHWKFYNDLFRDQLLIHQNPDGSWKAPAFSGHGQTPAADVYRNTLCVLMLEVYYRFLNSSGGSKERPGI